MRCDKLDPRYFSGVYADENQCYRSRKNSGMTRAMMSKTFLKIIRWFHNDFPFERGRGVLELSTKRNLPFRVSKKFRLNEILKDKFRIVGLLGQFAGGLWRQRLFGILMLFGILNFGFGISNAHAGWTEGKHNSAIEFNGTTTFIDGFGAIGNIKTVSFWMKADDITSRKIMDFDGTDQIEIDGSGNILATSFPGTVAIYIDGVDKTASPTVDTDWHHIAITTDANVNASAVVIGKVAASFFDGTLDDVKIYAYARSADEILLDYNAGIATHLGPSGKTCAQDPAGCVDYGLVGSWGMDEGAGTTAYDASDNGNDGTLTGGPVWTTDSPPSLGGAGGGSLKFDGVDDYVDAGSDSSLNMDNSSYTLSAWVYPTEISDYNFIAGATSGNSYRYHAYSLLIYNSEYIMVGSNGTNSDTVMSISTVTSNEWTHIVGVYNGTTQKIYINGILDITESTAYNHTFRTSNFRIGRANTIFFFDGSIDDVRIYNRALSAEEVRYHYNKGGPVAHWNFNEGSGTTAFDSSINRNNGTLTGASHLPTWTSGKFGSAIDFDGVDDYVDAGNDASFDVTDAITMEAWVKIDSWTGDYTGIIYKANSYFTALEVTGNQRIYARLNTDVGTKYEYAPANWIDYGVWKHIAFVFDKTNSYFYSDGVLLRGSTSNSYNSIDVTVSDVQVGYSYGSLYFNGSIDDVRIYNYARSADEIRLDYNNGVATHLK